MGMQSRSATFMPLLYSALYQLLHSTCCRQNSKVVLQGSVALLVALASQATPPVPRQTGLRGVRCQFSKNDCWACTVPSQLSRRAGRRACAAKSPCSQLARLRAGRHF